MAMRDPKRIDVMLEQVRTIWKKNPDLRLLQLLLNVVGESFAYHVEDGDLSRRLEATYMKQEKPDVLDYEFWCADLSQVVKIRDYFKRLLTELWVSGEGFSSKRPLGSSDWQYQIYEALVKGGYVDGMLDVDGCLEYCNERMADRFVTEQIIARLCE